MMTTSIHPLRFAVPAAWVVGLVFLCTSGRAADVDQGAAFDRWESALQDCVVDYYQDPEAAASLKLPFPGDAMLGWSEQSRKLVSDASVWPPIGGDTSHNAFPFAVGRLRGRMQQAIAIEMAAAVRAGRTEDAKALRVALFLPRGVSAVEGALVLQSLVAEKGPEAARILTREAITWQTTRIRQLLDEATRSVQESAPMPGRLMERLGEAMTLADLPAALRAEAGVESAVGASSEASQLLATIRASDRQLISTIWHRWSPLEIVVARTMDWYADSVPLAAFRGEIEERLPSLLTAEEQARRERLLLKLIEVIPREYASGIRDGQISVPLEYHEAIAFTQQARQIHGELAPIWLADRSRALAPSVEKLEAILQQADAQIAAKQNADAVADTLKQAGVLLRDQFGISLYRGGTTADIVGEVMIETKARLGESLAAALAGKWADAEQLRVEAYTTYDPELEARLMPRDPQLATDIERLLLDGLEDDKPGVKALLDRHASPEELQAAYGRVSVALDRAAAMLKSGISPTAAAMNAGSIVLREGLEGLLVIVAIFAGLRGAENARRRRLFWLGIAASMGATGITWVLSQTLLTSLRSHSETIAAVTGILAIGVLLLITNWLFHQVYWRQWVTTLKAQAVEGESTWQLVMAGFLVGYREGFETVLFLQSLVLEAGGASVGIGVGVGLVLLLALGVAALWVGMKLPYFKILMITALMIGVVLITFVGGTVRAAQTIGWLPVHRLLPGSWPVWMGNWLGLYNTWESIGFQVMTAAVVLGTWRIARLQAKRKAARRRQGQAQNLVAATCAGGHEGASPISGCDVGACDPACAAGNAASEVEPATTTRPAPVRLVPLIQLTQSQA